MYVTHCRNIYARLNEYYTIIIVCYGFPDGTFQRNDQTILYCSIEERKPFCTLFLFLLRLSFRGNVAKDRIHV